MAKPQPIAVTETAREERANWRALCEAGFVTAAEYVARFSKPPAGLGKSDDDRNPEI